MPAPSREDLEQRIRDALREIADESDRLYDLKLTEAQRAARLQRAEKAFLDGGVEISGELKSALLSGAVKVRIGGGASIARVVVVSVALLIGLALVIGGVYVLLTASSHPKP